MMSRIGRNKWFRWLSFFCPVAIVLCVMGIVLGNMDDLVMSSWTLVCLVLGISIGSTLTWQKQEGERPDIIPEAQNRDLYDKIREEYDMSPDDDEEIAPPGAGGL